MESGSGDKGKVSVLALKWRGVGRMKERGRGSENHLKTISYSGVEEVEDKSSRMEIAVLGSHTRRVMCAYIESRAKDSNY